ncbi:hypothetical protein PN836_012985 [Ningiella sp. W23]|uniref:hypothetical protein n=1 Tax=Ningiella sp. W23 TaxID=3023715 RepID=UPI0037570724
MRFTVTTLFMLKALLLTCVLSPSTFAQDPRAQQTQASQLEEEKSAQVQSQAPLRLEETIRANKEQPQVLTIVPWQLPTHQRINETQNWQPVVNTLPSIERNQFLQELALRQAYKTRNLNPNANSEERE